MRAGTQITVLVSAAALALGIGIPVLAFTLTPTTELVQGTVVSVVPAEHAVLVHSLAGAEPLRGCTVLIRVPPGQRVRIPRGSENVDQLRNGQQVTARVRPGSLRAQWITVGGTSATSSVRSKPRRGCG